jgi:glucose-6-phosphate 1-dehydrogenase
MAEEACRKAAGSKAFDAVKFSDFARMLDYVTMDATDAGADWEPLRSRLANDGRPTIFYLATTPLIYVAVCDALGRAGLNGPNVRVVLEKPIGTDLESARAINTGVGRVFPERSVFRIDHYLGKETVQNLLVLRFANALFEPVWSRNAIDHVQITTQESLGLEDRADYYDRSGALRDMVQNHMLQLLCLTAMEPPNSLEADDVRTEKIKVLRALKPITAQDARAMTVRGQYGAGLINGQPVRAYAQELTARNATTKTETFVAIKAHVDNWRWAGVPFYLRTGKRMPSRRSEIVIKFKPAPHPLFGTTNHYGNRLVIRLQPDEGMRLFVQVKEPGPGGLRLKSLPLNLSYAENFALNYPDAYERLLMDVVRGNLSLFMRSDEVEAAWQWVDRLIASWTEVDMPVEIYPAGQPGPLSAAMLLDRDGRAWWEE